MFRILISLAVAAPVLGAEFTLDQAIALSLRQNRDLRAAVLALDAAGHGVEAAAAGFQWALRPGAAVAVGDATETRRAGLAAEKTLTAGTAFSAGPQVTSLTGDGIEPQKTAAVRLQVEQPLFRRFGELQNREILTRAERSVLTARRELELRRNDLVVQVAASHESLLQLQQTEHYDRAALERLDRISRLTAARERQGRAARADTLRAELQRGRAESTLQATRERLDSGRREHADLLGFAPTTDIVALAGARLDIVPPLPAVAAAIAWSNRLDYAQVLQDLRDAERGVKIAQRNLQPDISLVARYDWLGQGVSYGDAMNLNDNAWFVGLSAGNNDLLKRSERAALKQAGTGRLATELRVDVVRHAVERQALNELSSYRRAEQQAAIEERNYAVAAGRAKLSRRLYEMEHETAFNVSDAEDQLRQAEIAVLSARAEVSVAAFRVLRALGTLLEAPADLKPGH